MTLNSAIEKRANPHRSNAIRSVLAVAFMVGAAAPCAAQTASRLAPCPAKGDTVSLLQPADSAFEEAKAITTFLNHAGFSVRCVTRSDWAGLAGIGNIATFQTTRGTITVFIVPASERFQMMVMRAPRGYRITYSKRGAHPTRTVIDANNPQYVVERGTWYFHMLETTLADDVRGAVEGSPY